MKKKLGFTLVELLVVMAILGILSSIAFGQYRNSQKKARDAQRQSDLSNIARALEMYYNDNGTYPLSSDEGKIMAVVDAGEDATEVNWGSAFLEEYELDEDVQSIIYMKLLPRDPESSYSYCYDSTNGTKYALYSMLENENSNKYCADPGYTCNSVAGYRYAIFSSNLSVTCPATP